MKIEFRLVLWILWAGEKIYMSDVRGWCWMRCPDIDTSWYFGAVSSSELPDLDVVSEIRNAGTGVWFINVLGGLLNEGS